MTVLAYTDGASRGNPGEAGIGVVLKDEAGETLASFSDFIGTTTNNVAEYTALTQCLAMAKNLRCSTLIVHSDSELMVRQLQGSYKVKNKELRKHVERIRVVLSNAPYRFEIKHIARDLNAEADELANRGIDLKRAVNSLPRV